MFDHQLVAIFKTKLWDTAVLEELSQLEVITMEPQEWSQMDTIMIHVHPELSTNLQLDLTIATLMVVLPESSQMDIMLIHVPPESSQLMVPPPVTQPMVSPQKVELNWQSRVLTSSKTPIHGVNKIHLSNSDMLEDS